MSAAGGRARAGRPRAAAAGAAISLALALALPRALARAQPPAAEPAPAQAKRVQPQPAAAAPAGDKLAPARAEFEQGRAAYRAGRLKQALAHLSRAYALAPSPEIEFDLARLYERVGEPTPAVRHFRAYLAQSQVTAAERAQIEARIDKLLALKARQRAQLRAPPPSRAALAAEARTFFERGKKLFAAARYEAALAAFGAARRFASLPELAYDMALAAERLGRPADAVDYYRTYLREAEPAPDAGDVQARIETLLTDRSPQPAAR